MLPWTPSTPVKPFTHICLPSPYPWAVETHHQHEQPPHLPSQQPSLQLKSGRSSNLAHSKSNVFMMPWSPSTPVTPFTHIYPPSPSIPISSQWNHTFFDYVFLEDKNNRAFSTIQIFIFTLCQNTGDCVSFLLHQRDQDGCQARVFCSPTRPKSEPKSATF